MMMNSDSKISGNGNGTWRRPHPFSHDRPLTFHDYVRVLYKNRYLISISFLVIVSATLLYTVTTEPVYEATAKIMVEQKGGMGESLFDFTTMIKKETMINNQVEILKSRSLAEMVIRDLCSSEQARHLRVLGRDTAAVDGYRPAWWQWLWRGDGDDVGETEEQRFDHVTEILRHAIDVTPIRNTDMIEIRVRALSPFESA